MEGLLSTGPTPSSLFVIQSRTKDITPASMCPTLALIPPLITRHRLPVPQLEARRLHPTLGGRLAEAAKTEAAKTEAVTTCCL